MEGWRRSTAYSDWTRPKWEKWGRRGQRESITRIGSRGGTTSGEEVMLVNGTCEETGPDKDDFDVPFAFGRDIDSPIS